MAAQHDDVWDLLIEGSDELALELDLPDFSPAVLPAVDRWLKAQRRPLQEEDLARLGALLGRVLVETHDGGLTRIAEEGHPLRGEWAVGGFQRGLDGDYHVPIFVSALRMGADRNLGAAEWYAALLREGGTAPRRPAPRTPVPRKPAAPQRPARPRSAAAAQPRRPSAESGGRKSVAKKGKK